MNEQVRATPSLTTLQDAPAYWQVGILWAMLTTGEQTGGTYSLIWELCPRGSGPTPHFHDQDEQFYVLEGEITYLADGQELRATAGSFVLIPRGTVHSFRVDSETATLLNSYTPAGFERVITELGEPAGARTLPPPHPHPPVSPDQMEKAQQLFREVGMHLVHGPDVLREDRAAETTSG
ncbi:cupin domain-containing protein [Deinococcus aestuarii]|uniref:cupin domain-containing protein n=1 Tax=Deinococcus aestuarii TaxID=2774531 RepID=UPI001C0C674F|nr:cupin domain-containing protein [Deinococcus aestuarii]